MIKDLADDYEGQVEVRKLNVDDSPQAASTYGIRNIPTLALFYDGEIQETLVGIQPKATLEQLIKKYVQ